MINKLTIQQEFTMYRLSGNIDGRHEIYADSSNVQEIKASIQCFATPLMFANWLESIAKDIRKNLPVREEKDG